ncbi:WW domain protein [Xylogone sp. PMI_703]|nr:WW domain protein [Xylogone sp. PMI_703]
MEVTSVEEVKETLGPQDTLPGAERVKNSNAGEEHIEDAASRTIATQDGREREASHSEDDVSDTVKDETAKVEQNDKNEEDGDAEQTDAPPLPEEPIPPLPNEELPSTEEADDGWAPIWDEANQAFYFYNRFTGVTQWNNPRVPDPAQPAPPGVSPPSAAALPNEQPPTTRRPAGGYDPAIHGDYDENAWYAQPAATEEAEASSTDPKDAYAATAAFNRFTGRFQAADLTPDKFNDENKSRRQMNAYFDVDAAANSHDGRSLKAERSAKKLTKAELKQFKEKRKAKKEERRRAWLRD